MLLAPTGFTIARVTLRALLFAKTGGPQSELAGLLHLRSFAALDFPGFQCRSLSRQMLTPCFQFLCCDALSFSLLVSIVDGHINSVVGQPCIALRWVYLLVLLGFALLLREVLRRNPLVDTRQPGSRRLPA